MKLGNLNELFNNTMEAINLENERKEKEKDEMLKSYAKAYEDLVIGLINNIKKLGEDEEIGITNKLIGDYNINNKYCNSSVKMTEEELIVYLYFSYNKRLKRSKEYNDDELNMLLRKNGITVTTRYRNMDENPSIAIYFKKMEKERSKVNDAFVTKIQEMKEKERKYNESFAAAYVELVYNVLREINDFNKEEVINVKSPVIGDFYVGDKDFYKSSAIMVEHGINIKLKFNDYKNKYINTGDYYNEKLINEMLSAFGIKIQIHPGICDRCNPSIAIVYIREDDKNNKIDMLFDKKMEVEYAKREVILEINKKYAMAYINLISNVTKTDISTKGHYEDITAKEELLGNYYTKGDEHYSSNVIMNDNGISIKLEYNDYDKKRSCKRDKAYDEKLINELLKEDGVHVKTNYGHYGLDSTSVTVKFTRTLEKGNKKVK